MVIMAGMLPGVESARRHRLRQAGMSGAAEAEASTGTRRRPSSCHDQAHLGSTVSKSRSKEMIHGWMLDSNAREAKERLDQKLRSQRESVVKRHHSTGSLRLPISKAHASSSRSTDDGGDGSTAIAGAMSLRREVFTKKGRKGRFSWGRLGWKASEQAECAVCLEEFSTGDILVHLPCAHRFHWACAVPWLQAASRCPFCRAAVPGPAYQI